MVIGVDGASGRGPYIQTYGSQDLYLNPVGNDVVIEGGNLNVENGIYSGPAANTTGANTHIMWKTFTGIGPGLNSTETIFHGITNGRSRILSVSVNVQCDATAVSGVPADAFIAGAGNMQDEKSATEEYQTYYDDTNIYLHIDAGSTAINDNRYTIIVIYASADLY